MKYGVDNCIADTMGPGGIFRALRHIPALLEIAEEMRELCPNAILFNYANPMAMCCWALGTVPGLQFVGLCHGVQTTMDLIASYTGRARRTRSTSSPPASTTWRGSCGWSTRGKDLYPLLKANFEKPGFYVNEKVRGEVMRHFGYFMTESTGHLSEYLPYFRKNRKALELYCDEPAFGGETGAYYHYCAMIDEKFQKMDPLSIESTQPRTAQRRVLLAHHRGQGDRAGLPPQRQHPQRRLHHQPARRLLRRGADLRRPDRAASDQRRRAAPRHCAALNMTNVLVQGLSVDAGPDRRPRAAGRRPCAHGPAHRGGADAEGDPRDDQPRCSRPSARWLPQFAGKEGARRSRPSPSPANVKRQEVPLDPALAIANRFGKLAQV